MPMTITEKILARVSGNSQVKPGDRVKITPDLAKRFEVEGEKGVIVTAIENDSVAAEKGISPGDIVTRINSAPVDSVATFKAALGGEDFKKGVIVHLTSEGSQRFEVLKQYE